MHGTRRILSAVLLLMSVSTAFSLNQLFSIECDASSACTLQSQRTLAYHVYTLAHPYRAVIEVHDVSALPKPRVALTKNSLLQGVHYFYYGATHTFRAVLELATPVTIQAQRDPTDATILKLQLTQDKRRHNFLSRALPTRQHEGLPPPAATGVGQAHEVAATHQRKVVVVIDAGHGGKDPGASGPNGIQEKRIVLQIAQRLAQSINRQPGFMAVMTRQGDYYLTLRQRLSVARKYKPDMFVAIHADAYPSSTALGASVYALSLRGATSEAARWIADKENESELTGGLDLATKSGLIKSVLLDLSQSMTIRSSLQIGRRIITSLGQIGHLHHDRVEQAAFVVLKSPDIPSLLVETGFISNPYEERKLLSAEYQQQLAEAIQSGICHYFEQQPPRNTWLADQRYHDIGLVRRE